MSKVKDLAKMFTAVPEHGIYTAESGESGKLKKTQEICGFNVPEEDVIAFIDTSALNDAMDQFIHDQNLGFKMRLKAKFYSYLARKCGFILTPTALYQKTSMQSPIKYTFQPGMKVSMDDKGNISINEIRIGGFICPSQPLQCLKKFFEELQKYIDQMKTDDFDAKIVNNPTFNVAKVFTPNPVKSIYVYPDIDNTCLTNAINTYAKGVSPEDVLVLIDHTLKGSGKTGALLTRTKLYVKNILGDARTFTLHQGQKITFDQDYVLIDGALAFDVFVHSGEKNPLDLFVPELQKYVDTLAPAENTASKYFTNNPKAEIYVAPDLPEDMLTNAIDAYAKGVSPEEVLVLLDDTLSKNGKQGILVTRSKIYIKEPLEDVFICPLNKELKITLEGKKMELNGTKYKPATIKNDDFHRFVLDLQKYVDTLA